MDRPDLGSSQRLFSTQLCDEYLRRCVLLGSQFLNRHARATALMTGSCSASVLPNVTKFD